MDDVMLTERQARVLAFLRQSIERNGYPPTCAEIARNFGWRSGNAAHEHLRAIERKGFIERVRGISRGIRLVAA